MKTKLTLALAAILTSSAFAAMPAKLPEFMNSDQLAKWRAETDAKNAAKAESAPSASDVPAAFYTGKPYIESTGTYAFKYRSYNPEMARWTSEDPSGYPDGVNNLIYVSNLCTTYYDSDGLLQELVTFENYTLVVDVNYTWAQWLSNGLDPLALLAAESAAFDEFKRDIALQFPILDQRIVGTFANNMTHYYPDGVQFVRATESIQHHDFESIDPPEWNSTVRSIFRATVCSTRVNYYE